MTAQRYYVLKRFAEMVAADEELLQGGERIFEEVGLTERQAAGQLVTARDFAFSLSEFFGKENEVALAQRFGQLADKIIEWEEEGDKAAVLAFSEKVYEAVEELLMEYRQMTPPSDPGLAQDVLRDHPIRCHD